MSVARGEREMDGLNSHMWGDHMSGNHMWGDHMAGGWMLLWWLLGVAALALLVWAVVRLAGRTNEPRSPRRTEAEEILERRYARGEIDREQFLRIREDLRQH